MPTHEIRNTTSQSTDYTVKTADRFVMVDATSAAITITLPLVSTCTVYEFSIKKTDSTLNTVTIDGAGSETIDDDLTQLLESQYECLTIVSDGSEWWIV